MNRIIRTIKIAFVMLVLAADALAQDFKDPIRIVNERRVHLHPLFVWWTNAAAISASNVSRSEPDRLPLPERPLRAWARVTSSELTNTGFAWIARATIQESPDGPASNQLVVLRHGPFEEKKTLDQAVANYHRTTANLNIASNAQSASLERATALRQKANLYQEMYNVDPHRHLNLGHAANVYRRAAVEARRAAQVASDRMNHLDARRSELFQITQGRDALTVDTFALRTGETYQNLPVFEMGLRFGR